MPEELISEDEIAFVMCAESNRLEPQAVLLCESIRNFGGRFATAPIIAISPRPDFSLSPWGRAQLNELSVTYVTERLNKTGSTYGTINRIVAAAWAEAHSDRKYLVLLDTDMVLVREPQFKRADVGVRPIDMKGSASSGPGDAFEPFWVAVCNLAGINIELLPTLKASIDGVSVRASYNGGFAVVRRSLGIWRHTQEVFLGMLKMNLRPWKGVGMNVFSSTGFVGEDASEWWGSSQAAMSAAIWSKTRGVYLYDNGYNIPAHLLIRNQSCWRLEEGSKAVLFHYHYLMEPPYRAEFLRVLLGSDCCSSTVRWIEERFPLFD